MDTLEHKQATDTRMEYKMSTSQSTTWTKHDLVGYVLRVRVQASHAQNGGTHNYYNDNRHR
jgi:hypothetical protein